MEGPAGRSGQLDAGRLGDKIFLTQANKGGTVRSLSASPAPTASCSGRRTSPTPRRRRNWNQNWYANASPATDGERVVVSFGSAGMYCYDFDGKELWKRTDLGKWEHAFGNGSSPVLYGDLAILWCGPNESKGRNFLLAVNKKTGETVWEHDETVRLLEHAADRQGRRPGPAHPGPVARREERARAKTGFLKGFDPKTGKELWKCQGLNSYVYTSPLVRQRRRGGMSGYGGSALGRQARRHRRHHQGPPLAASQATTSASAPA